VPTPRIELGTFWLQNLFTNLSYI